MYKEDAAVYVNGTVEGVEVLEGEMVDFNRTLLLGQISNGKHRHVLCDTLHVDVID